MPHRAATVLQAAERVVAVQARYAAGGKGMAEAALAGARSMHTLRHYPDGDVIDHRLGNQFYYHAHGSHRRPANEHGHFHLFMRLPTSAPAAAPAPAGGNAPAPASAPVAPRFFHLAALSLDAQGWPLRWFTTNRWVTGEDWVDAATAIAALPRFAPVTTGRLAPVATWLGAMVVLYADALAALLRRRDNMLARRGLASEPDTVLEDRRLDVVSQLPVSLPLRLQQLAARV